MGYIRPLLSLSFWLNIDPGPFVPWTDRFLLFFMLVLLALSAVVWIVAHRQLLKDRRRLFQRVSAWLLWAGLSGLLLYLFVWQRIPVLDMRLFWVVWLIGYAWWGYVIGRFAFKELPALNAAQAERAKYEKWLPKPRK